MYIFRNINATFPSAVLYDLRPSFGLILLLTSPKFSAIAWSGSSFFILPNSSFQTLTYRGYKNRTPRIRYWVLIQQNFLLLTCRFILRFLQIQLGPVGGFFSPYQIYKIFNTLAINSLDKDLQFPTVPNYRNKLCNLCFNQLSTFPFQTSLK